MEPKDNKIKNTDSTDSSKISESENKEIPKSNTDFSKPLNNQISSRRGITILVMISLLFISALLYFDKDKESALQDLSTEKNSERRLPPVTNINNINGNKTPEEVSPTNLEGDSLQKFKSVEDFKDYLEKAEQSEMRGYGRGGGMRFGGDIDFSMNQSIAPMTQESSNASNVGGLGSSAKSAPTPERVSDTNVQVLGIDEPDVVKTDGEDIYFSKPPYFDGPIIMEERLPIGPSSSVPPPQEKNGGIKVIAALPAKEAKIIGQIDKTGEMFLLKDTLVVFAEYKHKIYGYDVSDPTEPKEKWKMEIKDQGDLVGARLYNDKIYLSSRQPVGPETPCPIEPFVLDGAPVKIECTDIYHPINPIPVDVTYNFLSLDARTGKIENEASFVGPWSDSAIYMSKSAIYLTYTHNGDYIGLITNFLTENKDLFPTSLVERAQKVKDYDLSSGAKSTEIENMLSKHLNSIPGDDRMKLNNELSNRLDQYLIKHSRETEVTGIVKIGLNNLEVLSTGNVPGKPLNQFSLDEFGGNLRIATTFGDFSGWFLGMGFSTTRRIKGASDVYVLDSSLKKLGSVLNLAVGERIYSVRFIEDKGYVVTFKQVDPFFVLDLSNPLSPELKGELKIPGYSSYLHPVSANKILGVGEEGGKVKLTLFDVSVPESPKELNTYKLDEYYSEVASTHHAFLMDSKHNIFFLPGSKGGYVFAYTNDKLELKKTLSEILARRALYINDFLYIIGDDKMIILDENNWEKVKELDLE